MKELIVSKKELMYLFETKSIQDTKDGWLLENECLVEIIALHDIEIRFLNDITNAKFYKIILKDK